MKHYKFISSLSLLSLMFVSTISQALPQNNSGVSLFSRVERKNATIEVVNLGARTFAQVGTGTNGLARLRFATPVIDVTTESTLVYTRKGNDEPKTVTAVYKAVEVGNDTVNYFDGVNLTTTNPDNNYYWANYVVEFKDDTNKDLMLTVTLSVDGKELPFLTTSYEAIASNNNVVASFVNEDGTLLGRNIVKNGGQVSYDGKNVEKEFYTFVGWSDGTTTYTELPTITTDTVFAPVFEKAYTTVTNYDMSNGTVYSGRMFANLPDGEGTLTFTDSNCVYTGTFVNGVYHGQGTFTWPDGSKIVGTFENGNPVTGEKTFANGEKYVGGFVNWNYSGQGTYTYADGCQYVGQFANNVFNGEGTFTWPGGWKFEGTFENGTATYGKTTTNKTTGLVWYEGAMIGLNDIDSTKVGIGYYVYPDNCNYTGGMYASGALLDAVTFTGQGKFMWGFENCWIFEGTFENGTATYGKTITTKTTGLIWYEGAMNGLNNIDSTQIGIGYYVYEDGTTYTGDMTATGALETATFNGQGTMCWNNGNNWTGEFENNSPKKGTTGYMLNSDGSKTWIYINTDEVGSWQVVPEPTN